MTNILIVDDEKSMGEYLGIMLKKEGYKVTVALNAEEALQSIKKGFFDLVVSDIQLPTMSGLELLKQIKNESPATVVIMITAYASTDTAIEAMKNGAYDYIIKPFKNEEIKLIIKNSLEKKQLEQENVYLKEQLENREGLGNIIGMNENVLQLGILVQKIANNRSNVLIFGESGTGKELVARAIHQVSDKKDKPFVAINCGAMPEGLLESELFGHVKGSFTGAVVDKKGLFEIADGGILFLDEISNTPLSIQAKLLRVLQEKEFRRVGGTEDIKVDVRLISATNRDLEEDIKKGLFREDLYYRLNVIPVNIPPLRERKDDILLLVNHFKRKYSLENKKPIPKIASEVINAIVDYDWPGNVRELENVIERCIALETDGIISLDILPHNIREYVIKKHFVPSIEANSRDAEVTEEGIYLDNIVNKLEKELILRALEVTRGKKTEAAKLLNITFRSLRHRIKKLGIGEKEEDKKSFKSSSTESS
ncbi:MAG: sigma-54 dependent transcriptional regulator [bacterium]